MKLKHLLLASASSFLFYHNAAVAQSLKNYGCYTDEHNRELELQYPQILKNRQAFEQYYQQNLKNPSANQKISAAAIKIPVVVHVVTEKGLNGISKAQVLNGVEVLNRDFQRLNPDTVNTHQVFRTAPYILGSNLGVEFVMARIDPNGLPTEGIERITSFTTNGPVTRDDVKRAAPAWDPTKYFNIWLVQTINSESVAGGGTILGYAQFPDNNSPANLPFYGLVMLHTQWGKTGEVPGSTANSDGRTATHEAGHCFNLYHTFQGGCGTTNHTNSGDQVGDTPPTLQATYNQNCNPTQNTCHNDVGTGSPFTSDVVDMTENYMSYDDCQNMFTKGQRTRALNALTFFPHLINLTSASNATVTGIDPNVTVGPVVPIPYFGVQGDRVCAGNSVDFIDASYNGTPTTWNWSFPGGTPSTSTAQNPTVTYNTPGVYDVTLTTGNGAGTPRTVTKTGFITVVGTSNLDNVAIGKQAVEDFEDTTFPLNSATNRPWQRFSNSLTAGAATWEQTSIAASTGTYSLRLRNGSIGNGNINTLISPPYNVAGSSNLFYSFDLAYAANSSSPLEKLEVFASNDCGQNWKILLSKSGTALATTPGVISGNFIPAANQWRKEVDNVTPNLQGGSLQFKIEVTSRLGANLFFDNFRVYTVLGTNEEIAANNNIKVYPNPVTAETGINFELKTTQKVTIKVLDLIGNTVYNSKTTSFGPGSHSINLYDKMQGLKAGMYMVQLQMGDKVYNTKLIAQ